MSFVLEIVKDGYVWTSWQRRRGKARVEHHIDRAPSSFDRQSGLLVDQARRALLRSNRQRRMKKGIRDQIRPGLAIREDDIFVRSVNTSQSSKQITEIDLRAAHATWNEIQRVDANSH